MTPADRQLVRETEELLERMKDAEPFTRQQVADHYGFKVSDFPRWAISQNERELEKMHEMRRVFCSCRDRKSIALVHQIDQRIAEIRRAIRYWANR